jgi:hypothetical protein
VTCAPAGKVAAPRASLGAPGFSDSLASQALFLECRQLHPCHGGSFHLSPLLGFSVVN